MASEPQRIPYGEHPSQYAELTLPSGTPRGVVVVIHGGFWKAEYDASLGRPLAADLAARGWIAWNLEYRRVGDAGGVPETLDDVAAGIDALAEVGVPLERVITLGHSAGGHLATWAAARGRFSRWGAAVPVTRVVSQAGVLDLAAARSAGLGGGAVDRFLGSPPALALDQVDPLSQVPLDVPVTCVHPTGDEDVPPSQSATYVAAARAAGARADLVEVPGDHMVVIDVESAAWRTIVDLLDP